MSCRFQAVLCLWTALMLGSVDAADQSQQHPNSESNQPVPQVENEDLQQLGSKVNSEHTDSLQQSKEDVITDKLSDYDSEAEGVAQEHHQESPPNDTHEPFGQDALPSSTVMDQLHSDRVNDDSNEEDVTDMTDRQDDNADIIFIQHPEVDSQDEEGGRVSEVLLHQAKDSEKVLSGESEENEIEDSVMEEGEIEESAMEEGAIEEGEIEESAMEEGAMEDVRGQVDGFRSGGDLENERLSEASQLEVDEREGTPSSEGEGSEEEGSETAVLSGQVEGSKGDRDDETEPSELDSGKQDDANEPSPNELDSGKRDDANEPSPNGLDGGDSGDDDSEPMPSELDGGDSELDGGKRDDSEPPASELDDDDSGDDDSEPMASELDGGDSELDGGKRDDSEPPASELDGGDSGDGDSERDGGEDVLTFEEFKQKKLMEVEQKGTQETLSNIPISKTKNNYASVDCGAKVIESNKEAQNPTAILIENKDVYMLNPCSAKIEFVVELCEFVSVRTLEIACFELFSCIPESFKVHSSEAYPNPDWVHLGTFHASNKREVQSFPLATDESVYAKFIKVEMISHFGSEHYCPLSLLRVLGASMIEVYEYSEEQQHNSQHTPSVVLPASEGMEDELLTGVGEEEEMKNGTLLSAAKDAVLSLLDKPLKILGKVNGILKERSCDEEGKCGDTESTTQERTAADQQGSRVQHSEEFRDYGDDTLDSPEKDSIVHHVNDSDIEEVSPDVTAEEQEGTKDLSFDDDSLEGDHQGDETRQVQSSPSDLPELKTSEGSVPHSSSLHQPPGSQSPPEVVGPLGPEVPVEGDEYVNNGGGVPDMAPSNPQIDDIVAMTTSSEVQNSSEVISTQDETNNHSSVDVALKTGDTVAVQGTTMMADTSAISPDPTIPITLTTQLPEHTDSTTESLDTTVPNQTNESTSNGTGKDSLGNGSGGPIEPLGNGATGGGQPKEKSVFVRLSNRIRDLEENMSLFSSYLDQISTSLKRNKNKTEDAQRSLDKRISAVDESIQALKLDTEINMAGLHELHSDLQEVVSLMGKVTMEIDSMKHEVLLNQFYTLAAQTSAVLLSLLLFCMWLNYKQNTIHGHLYSLQADVSSLHNHEQTAGIQAAQHIRSNSLGSSDMHKHVRERDAEFLGSSLHNSLEGSGFEPWQVASRRRKGKSTKPKT